MAKSGTRGAVSRLLQNVTSLTVTMSDQMFMQRIPREATVNGNDVSMSSLQLDEHVQDECLVCRD